MFLVGVSAIFFFLGINGAKITKFAVGPIEGETSLAKKALDAEKEVREKGEPIEEVQVNEDIQEEEIEPSFGSAGEHGEFLGEKGLFYTLENVPVRVLQDALNNWPSGIGEPPHNLSEFEFAFRREGRGNHPWILKFQNKPPVRVSYGGQSKTGATVNDIEESNDMKKDSA